MKFKCEIVYCRSAYLVLSNKLIREWHYDEMELDLKVPNNLEDIPVRCINAVANGKTLSEEFENDFDLSNYSLNCQVLDKVHKTVERNNGLSDVFIFIKDIGIALRMYKVNVSTYEFSHLKPSKRNTKKFCNIMMVNSWKELKSYV